eukprot:gene19650-biopygen5254
METYKYTPDAVVATTVRRPPPATPHPPPPPATNVFITRAQLTQTPKELLQYIRNPPAPDADAGAIGVALAVAHALASAFALGGTFALGEGGGCGVVTAAGRFDAWAAGAHSVSWARRIAAQTPLADPAAAAASAPAPSAECGTGRGGQLRASVSLPQPQTQVW